MDKILDLIDNIESTNIKVDKDKLMRVLSKEFSLKSSE